MAQGGENCSTFAHWGPQCCSQARPLKTLDVELIPILPISAPCTFHNVNQKLTCSISQSTCTTLLLVVSQNRCVSDPSSPTPTIQTCRAWPLTLFHNDLSQLESCHFGSVYWVYCLNVCHAESVPDICVTKYRPKTCAAKDDQFPAPVLLRRESMAKTEWSQWKSTEAMREFAVVVLWSSVAPLHLRPSTSRDGPKWGAERHRERGVHIDV